MGPEGELRDRTRGNTEGLTKQEALYSCTECVKGDPSLPSRVQRLHQEVHLLWAGPPGHVAQGARHLHHRAYPNLTCISLHAATMVMTDRWG